MPGDWAIRWEIATRAGHVLSTSVCLARWFQDCWLEGSLLAGGDQRDDGQDDPQSFGLPHGRTVCWYNTVTLVLFWPVSYARATPCAEHMA